MQIRCDHCQAAYDVDPPAGSAAALVEMMFRCTECGRTFPICFGEPEVAAPSPEPAQSSGAPEGLLLKQDGKVYHVKDMAKLQRWIAERRVLGTDEVSRAGGQWQQVGKIEELAVFFQLLDQADQLEAPGLADNPGLPEPTDIVMETVVQEVSLPPVELNLPNEAPAVGELALDGIPDESELPPMAEELLGPDDPTMDLGEDVGDFFSEEVPRPGVGDAQIFDAHTEEYDPDDDPDFVWAKQRRRQTYLWWGILFAVGTGLGVWGFDALNEMDKAKTKTVTVQPSATQAPAAPDAGDAPVAADSQAAPDAQAAVVPDSESTVLPQDGQPAPADKQLEAPETVGPDKPEVIQTPIDAAKKDKDKPSGRAENSKGWKAVDAKKWAKAKSHFETALANRGGTESRFGLAYVMEHQGNTGRATGMYCKIAKSGRGEFQREAQGRLNKLRHTCP